MISEVNQEKDKLIAVKESTDDASNLMERVIAKQRLLETGINNMQTKVMDLNIEKKVITLFLSIYVSWQSIIQQKMESLKELNQVLAAKEEYARSMKEGMSNQYIYFYYLCCYELILRGWDEL